MASDYLDDMFRNYGSGEQSTVDEHSTPYELVEQRELLHERLQLAIEERKKYEAMRAAYQAKSVYEETRIKRLRFRKAILKLKEQIVRLREARDRMQDHRFRAQIEANEAVSACINLYLKTQTTLSSEYDRKALEEVLTGVAEDNPELCCPACQTIPTKVLLGGRFCASCGWKPGDESDETPF